MKKKKPMGCLFGLIVVLFLILFYYWQNFTLQTTRYDLAYANLPESFEGFTIVQISDMHGMTFGTQNKDLVRAIEKIKPDLLVLTGDMISSHAQDGQAFLDFLEGIGKQFPTYMCLGNHEQIADYNERSTSRNLGYSDFIQKVRDEGVIILDNKRVDIKKENEAISLYGLTPEIYHYSRRDSEYADDSLLLKRDYIQAVIGKQSNQFNLVLCHNPNYFKEYVAWGADLTLSGHIHGGIIQVPFKGGLLSPERLFFPEYDAGLFEENGRRMIVNRGLGYSQINMRLFNRPEISQIVLHKGDQ